VFKGNVLVFMLLYLHILCILDEVLEP